MKKILKRFGTLALCMGLVMIANSSTALAGSANGMSTKYDLEVQCYNHVASYWVTAKGDFFNPTGQAELRYIKNGQVRRRYIEGRAEKAYWYAHYANSNPAIRFITATVTADGVSVTAINQ